MTTIDTGAARWVAYELAERATVLRGDTVADCEAGVDTIRSLADALDAANWRIAELEAAMPRTGLISRAACIVGESGEEQIAEALDAAVARIRAVTAQGEITHA